MNFKECPQQNLNLSVLSGKRSPYYFLNERNLQMGDYVCLEREFKINLRMHCVICTEGSA